MQFVILKIRINKQDLSDVECVHWRGNYENTKNVLKQCYNTWNAAGHLNNVIKRKICYLEFDEWKIPNHFSWSFLMIDGIQVMEAIRKWFREYYYYILLNGQYNAQLQSAYLQMHKNHYYAIANKFRKEGIKFFK